MKITLLSFLVLVAVLASARGQSVTNVSRRISVAEVQAVRLEVEQPTIKNEVHIRVRDYAARNWKKKAVSCDVYYVYENGSEVRARQ